MELNRLRFLALFFVALALGPALAHLLELPNKMGLGREEYLTVQEIYSGWSLLGFVVAGALLSTLALTIRLRGTGRAFRLTLTALLCIVAAQALFWIFTFPANQATSNWTVLPDNWEALRTRWEYSHAAGALLNLGAMASLILSVLPQREVDA